jgi:hypothetical protein
MSNTTQMNELMIALKNVDEEQESDDGQSNVL